MAGLCLKPLILPVQEASVKQLGPHGESLNEMSAVDLAAHETHLHSY